MKEIKNWTKAEDELLIKFYPLEGTTVRYRLPNRTILSIKNRAQQLGILYRQQMFNWTEEEKNILIEYYPIEGKNVKNRLPNRTLKTIQVTAHRLGIKKKRGNR